MTVHGILKKEAQKNVILAVEAGDLVVETLADQRCLRLRVANVIEIVRFHFAQMVENPYFVVLVLVSKAV